MVTSHSVQHADCFAHSGSSDPDWGYRLQEGKTSPPKLSNPPPQGEGGRCGYLRVVEGEGFGASEALSRIWRHSVSRRSNWAWEIGWAGMGNPLFGFAATGGVEGAENGPHEAMR